MNRRTFLAVTGGMAMLGHGATARARNGTPRVGVLAQGVYSPDPSATDVESAAKTDSHCLDAFRRGLAEAGYVEGATHVLEVRRWGPYASTLEQQAVELARAADVIVVMSVPAAHRARANTKTVPIVLGPVPYPAEIGLVQDVRRPAGNVTGMALWVSQTMQERVALLKDAVPGMRRLAAFFRSPTLVTKQTLRDYDVAARRLAVDLLPIRVTREDVAAAFAAAMQERADAIVLTDDWLFFMAREQVGDLALRHRVPVLSAAPWTADAGILLCHVPPVLEVCHRSARFVDRILRGAKAGELPIEPAPRFEVVVNLKTAKVLGLTIPPSVLARANRVIE